MSHSSSESRRGRKKEQNSLFGNEEKAIDPHDHSGKVNDHKHRPVLRVELFEFGGLFVRRGVHLTLGGQRTQKQVGRLRHLSGIDWARSFSGEQPCPPDRAGRLAAAR